jgi:hypothetical protein
MEPLIRNLSGIALSNSLFQEILANTNTTGLEIAACEHAKENIPYAFELLGLQLNVHSMNWYCYKVLQHGGWFKIEELQMDHTSGLKLFHNYGYRWSLFLKSYLTSAYQLVTRRVPEITISDRVVKLSFSKYDSDAHSICYEEIQQVDT